MKNLIHVETCSGILVFKLGSKPIFRESKKEDKNCLVFSEEEKCQLKSIKIEDHFDIHADQADRISNSTTTKGSQPGILSLFDFCLTNPKDINSQQYVEVNCVEN